VAAQIEDARVPTMALEVLVLSGIVYTMEYGDVATNNIRCAYIQADMVEDIVQCRIVWHVNDWNISAQNSWVVDHIIKLLESELL
jgi:hypothetical protein